MKTYSDPNASLWARLIVLPAVVGLVSASIIVGYASSSFWPSHAAPVRMASLRFAQATPQAPGDAKASADADETADQNADPVADYKAALALLKNNYYGAQIDAKKSRQLTYEAIRGMLGSLRDQFTSFLDPDEWNQMQATTKGDFEGIGAILLQEGPEIKVNEPIENSPAEKVGLKPEDVIARVDGQSVIGKNINDVVRLIKGKRGTKVKIGIVRGKTPLEFVITRARVEPPVVKYWMEDKQAKIGHIVLKEFNEKSMEQMGRAFDDLKGQGMRGLIFDLRNNPGGLLDTAIQVSSAFIPRDFKTELENVVVHIREGSGQENRRLLRSDDYMEGHIPLVVLVNDSSASASEITSGAIKDYGIGTLIGERTYGKGRVQTLFPLEDGSALRLTTALYFPPKKNDINFKHDEDGARVPNTGGILPDIEVAQSDKWKGFNDKENDSQLQKGLEFLRARLKGMTVAQATQHVQKAH